ncbi:unnamed protein product [Nippostrongylus brasiliensis]|uniref:C2H2-type domain-containing protein n=1 Tax=Nippostrongylus brasiliensis TaxID=27835 RepID=A0A0N4XWZ5_NIPBR|nr:unnamed protein product [Nippostrongylus brasiliensis]
MSVFRNRGNILPDSFQKNCVFFRTAKTEDILPPCTPEKSVELCFHCIEGLECVDHPGRRKMQAGVTCFADDDFNLVDEHHIKNFHQSPDDTNSPGTVKVKQEPCEEQSRASPSIKVKWNNSGKRSLKSVFDLHREFYKFLVTLEPHYHELFSRFREKTFICDVCDAAFTLKQNVQSHLFIYHVQKDGSMKQHTRLMYKCSSCEKCEMLRFVAKKVVMSGH